MFTAGESIQVEICDAAGRKVIHVIPSELLLGARIIADNCPEVLQRVLDAIRTERERQLKLWEDEEIPFTCDAEDVGLAQKLGALTEEVGEVAREVNECEFALHPGDALRRLKTELIHVAAVATAWAESLENV